MIFDIVSIDAKGRHRAAGDEWTGRATDQVPAASAPPRSSVAKSFGTVTAARLGDWSPPSARPPMARRALPLAGSRWLPMPTEAPTSTMAAAEKRIQAATRYSAARGYTTLAMQPLIPKPSMTLPMLEQSAYAKETGSWVFAEVGPKREDPRETRRNSMAQASRRRSSAKEMMSSQSLPSLQRRKSSQRLTPTKKRAKRKSAAAGAGRDSGLGGAAVALAE